jgi:hypothetical protein
MPAASTMTGASGELDKLITNLCTANPATPCNNVARVQAVTVAACATAFGNANMLIN